MVAALVSKTSVERRESSSLSDGTKWHCSPIGRGKCLRSITGASPNLASATTGKW